MVQYYFDKAKSIVPEMKYTKVAPVGAVEFVADEKAYLGVKALAVPHPGEVFRRGDKFVLDFGNHYVGKISFELGFVDKYLDAPVRLRLKFGEIPYEVATDFAEYTGSLCPTWLQEEIVTLDSIGVYEFPRRLAFRYMEVEVIASPRTLSLKNFCFTAQTSGDMSAIKPLPEGTDPLLKKIDDVAAKTLADCMQSVYEDGPKRDRRLWSGDLRLQALTNYSLFNEHETVKRCLYLFASCYEEGKYLPGCLYYSPDLYYDSDMGIADYALIFAVTLCDYFKASGDSLTAEDIYPVAKAQVDLATSLHTDNGIITLTEGWASFIDWAPFAGYPEKRSALEGVYLYTLERMAELAEALGKKDDAELFAKLLEDTRKTAYRELFNEEKNAFVSKYDNFRYSVQAQIWMILGGVISGEKAAEVLRLSLADETSIKPVTPFMNHYLVDAMFKAGMKAEAEAHIKSYWGSMVELGADTFWEVHVPGQPFVSATGGKLMDSYCHAWSCSPSYFIREKLLKA